MAENKITLGKNPKRVAPKSFEAVKNAENNAHANASNTVKILNST